MILYKLDCHCDLGFAQYTVYEQLPSFSGMFNETNITEGFFFFLFVPSQVLSHCVHHGLYTYNTTLPVRLHACGHSRFYHRMPRRSPAFAELSGNAAVTLRRVGIFFHPRNVTVQNTVIFSDNKYILYIYTDFTCYIRPTRILYI